MTKTPRSTEPTIRRQELGRRLQALRKASGFTLDQAARRIDVSPSKLCRIERGQRPVAIDEIGGLLSFYNTDGPQRRQLLALARSCSELDWWQHHQSELADRERTLITLESEAERIVVFEPIVVPGLLQTGDYTQALKEQSGMMTASEIEEGLDQRVRRQSVLLRRQPPELLALIDELALQRIIGNPEVLRHQLAYLARAGQQPHISIRVIPNRTGHAGTMGPFTLIEQPGRSPVVFVGQPASNLFVEQQDQVEVYYQVLENLSTAAQDETQSRLRINANLAIAGTWERASDEPERPHHRDMAQEQLQRLEE